MSVEGIELEPLWISEDGCGGNVIDGLEAAGHLDPELFAAAARRYLVEDPEGYWGDYETEDHPKVVERTDAGRVAHVWRVWIGQRTYYRKLDGLDDLDLEGLSDDDCRFWLELEEARAEGFTREDWLEPEPHRVTEIRWGQV